MLPTRRHRPRRFLRRQVRLSSSLQHPIFLSASTQTISPETWPILRDCERASSATCVCVQSAPSTPSQMFLPTATMHVAQPAQVRPARLARRPACTILQSTRFHPAHSTHHPRLFLPRLLGIQACLQTVYPPQSGPFSSIHVPTPHTRHLISPAV